MKITPAEFTKNILNYTEDERKNIVLSMSPEELVQLQSHLTTARSSNASTPSDIKINPVEVSKPTSEPMETYVINKEYAALGSDEAFSECAKVFRGQSDKHGTWHSILDKLKRNEDRGNKAGITRLADRVTTAYVYPICESRQINVEYNKMAEKIYDVSKLWVILYQNLQNAGMDRAWDSMASGTETLRVFNSGVVTKPIKDKINKINNMFNELGKFVDMSLRYDLRNYKDLMINKAQLADDQLLVHMLLKKILFCMKYTWNTTLETYSGLHHDHWYDSTYANFFDTTFIDTCNNIIDSIKPEITRLQEEMNTYKDNGYKCSITVHPSCVAYMGTHDIHHLSPSAITGFLQNPETMPEGLSMDKLNFYDACVNIAYNETVILRWFNN